MPAFSVRVDVYHHIGDTQLLQAIQAVQATVDTILGKVNSMSAELDRLTTEVSEMAGVIDSAIVLINGLAQQIRDLVAAGTDPAALTALADSLDSKANELGAAVAANSPSPTPAP